MGVIVVNAVFRTVALFFFLKRLQENMQEKVYNGQCFCGGVQFTVSGAPEAMGFCHCASCRSWSAAPLNAFSLWKPTAVNVFQGAELVASFNKTEKSYRKWCSRCGGHLFTDHPLMKMIDVYAVSIPDLDFKPGVHVFYSEKVMQT
jgi:hypothetical protein